MTKRPSTARFPAKPRPSSDWARSGAVASARRNPSSARSNSRADAAAAAAIAAVPMPQLLIGVKLNFCPPILASYMSPPLACVKTATALRYLALADAPEATATALA
jgi:hypothetical protein